MGRYSRSRSTGEILGIDSLLDVVTNVIGALFFVIIYTVLSGMDIQGTITTPPMVSQTNTKPVYFECRNKTIIFPDIDGLVKEMIDTTSGKIAKSAAENNFYKAQLGLGNRGLLVRLDPIAEATGENEQNLRNVASSYQQKLNDFSSQEYHIFFFVREDSIELFHAARKVAKNKGFKVGWEPLHSATSLTLGGGGGREIPTGEVQ
jgi:hypothetical protein